MGSTNAALPAGEEELPTVGYTPLCTLKAGSESPALGLTGTKCVAFGVEPPAVGR